MKTICSTFFAVVAVFLSALPLPLPADETADRKIAAHSTEFREAAGSPRGLDAMLKAATALACTACRYLADERFREAVQRRGPEAH